VRPPLPDTASIGVPSRRAGSIPESRRLDRSRLRAELQISRRLSIATLGVSLTALVGLAWLTAIPYLAARIGVPSLLHLSVADGLHVVAGSAGAVFLLAKVWRVGLRRRVKGVSKLLLWQRWVSWSLLLLYGAVLVTGTVALLPLDGGVRKGMTHAHLLFSVWAIVPTIWHLWHYRLWARQLLGRLGGVPSRRLQAGLLAALLPALWVLAVPKGASQLSEVGAGPAWQPAGLEGVSLSQVTATPGGGELLAAGDGLYVSQDGRHWRHEELPLPASVDRQPAQPVLALATSAPSGDVYVATDDALFRAPRPEGPYTALPFKGARLRGLATDPVNPHVLWTATSIGPERSVDAGQTWVAYPEGLGKPGEASAVAFLDEDVYVSDSTGIYRFDSASSSWRQSAEETSVVDLREGDGPRLYASSTTEGVSVLDDGHWAQLHVTSESRRHGLSTGAAGALSATELGGRLYAAGTPDGVSASADQGSTWFALGAGLAQGSVRQLTHFRDWLWVATDDGLFRMQWLPTQPADPGWWKRILTGILVFGAAGVVLSALSVSPIGRRRLSAARPR
jgi:hypothetical protein